MMFLKSVYNDNNNNNNDIWVSFILRAILHGLRTLLHYGEYYAGPTEEVQ